MFFVNYSWCVDWWRYVSTTFTWPPSAGCLWRCYTCTDVWLRSAISITAPWSSTISLDTVSCRPSLFSVFSTKVGMIGFFCKREMVQWFNELQDVGGIIMFFVVCMVQNSGLILSSICCSDPRNHRGFVCGSIHRRLWKQLIVSVIPPPLNISS